MTSRPPLSSQLPEALQQAYRTALYRLQAGASPQAQAPTQTLKVGEPHAWLAQQLRLWPQHCACYLTACNPWGQCLSAADNALRMAQLRNALDLQGWSYLNGCGQDPLGQWPGEDSVLIWNMDAPTALVWGQQWEQNAVLWSGADGVPRLLWLR